MVSRAGRQGEEFSTERACQKPTLEENRLPDVGADGSHGVEVGEALLVLPGDGQEIAHVPDLMVDVVPPGFGCSFGGSVGDHGRPSLEEDLRKARAWEGELMSTDTRHKIRPKSSSSRCIDKK